MGLEAALSRLPARRRRCPGPALVDGLTVSSEAQQQSSSHGGPTEAPHPGTGTGPTAGPRRRPLGPVGGADGCGQRGGGQQQEEEEDGEGGRRRGEGSQSESCLIDGAGPEPCRGGTR